MKIIKHIEIPNGLGHTLSILGGVFYLFWSKDCFWFRFFRRFGIHAVHRNAKSYIPFGERMGYRKSVKLFGWTIKFLK